MIIKIPGEVQLDGNSTVDNARLNIPNNHQFRFKCNYKNEKIDIQADDFQFKFLSKGSTASMILSGINLLNMKPISLNIGFNVFKKSWVVKGNYGNTNIDFKFDTFPEFEKLLQTFIN